MTKTMVKVTKPTTKTVTNNVTNGVKKVKLNAPTTVNLKKTDKVMTNALAPHREKIKGLKDELNKQHEFIRNNNLYSLYKNNR
jgi:methylthioribose-1-phosphate isomerase